MKKITLTAIATAFLATAFSANAQQVYDSEGTKVDVYGQVSIFAGKDETTKTDLFNDKSRLGVTAKQELEGGLGAVGNIEFRFDDEKGGFGSPTVYSGYVGLKQDGIGTLTLGRQESVTKNVILSEYAKHRGDISLSRQHSDRSVKFLSDNFGGFQFGGEYTFKGSNEKHQKVSERGAGAAFFYTADLGGDSTLKFNGGYNFEQDALKGFDNDKLKRHSFLVGSEFKTGAVSVAVDYAHAVDKYYNAKTNKQDKDEETKADALQVAAKYAVDDTLNFYTSYQYGREKVKGDDFSTKRHQWTLGVDKTLHKNVSVYAEGMGIKHKIGSEKSDTEFGGALGLRVKW